MKRDSCSLPIDYGSGWAWSQSPGPTGRNSLGESFSMGDGIGKGWARLFAARVSANGILINCHAEVPDTQQSAGFTNGVSM